MARGENASDRTRGGRTYQSDTEQERGGRHEREARVAAIQSKFLEENIETTCDKDWKKSVTLFDFR